MALKLRRLKCFVHSLNLKLFFYLAFAKESPKYCNFKFVFFMRYLFFHFDFYTSKILLVFGTN